MYGTSAQNIKKIHLCEILQEVITVTHLLAHCSQLVS